MAYKLSSKTPSRQEIEKLASEIVITVKTRGADPYEEIHSTGLPDDLKTLLLRKFNIANFLDDFDNHDGDTHIRDVGSEPLSLSRLFECAPEEVEVVEEPGMSGTISKKKIDGPGVSGVAITKKTVGGGQVADIADMANVDVAKEPFGPKTKAETEAADTDKAKESVSKQKIASVYSSTPRHRLVAARDKAQEAAIVAAHSYKGYIEKTAQQLFFDKKPTQDAVELARVYANEKVASHVFAAADVPLVEVPRSGKYVVSNSKTADSIVARGTILLDKVAALLSVVDELNEVLESE